MDSSYVFDDYFEKLIGSSKFSSDYDTFFRKLSESKAKIAGKPLPTLFHPYVISMDELQFLKAEAEKMAAILKKTVDIYINNKEVRDFFDFPEVLREWIEVNPGFKSYLPISRYDAFWNSLGYQFCEFNTDGTSGMNEVNTLEEIFLSTYTGEVLRQKYSLEMLELRTTTLNTIIDNYHEFGGKGAPNLAIVDFTESATTSEFEALQKTFINRGIPTEICDIRELKYRNGRLWYKNFDVDVIYRRAVTDEMLENRDEIKDVINAYKDGAVCMVGPLRSQIVHSKLIFTFLCSDIAKKYFSPDEMQFIKRHIPQSQRLSSDKKLIHSIIKNKDQFILKPHNSYGSRGVYSGSQHSTEEWHTIVDKILNNKELKKNYIVQAKITIPRKKFIIDKNGNKKEFKVNLSPFVFNGNLTGFYTRVSEIEIITTNLGGKVLPLFVGNF